MNPDQLIRRAGYGFIRDSRTGHESYVRRLTRDFYPRLHMYIEEEDEKVIFNLHLDQKQASYEGAHMHNAEHDGEVVESEITRIKEFITQTLEHASESKSEDLIDRIGGNRNYEGVKREKKKSWWKFW